MFSPLNYYLYWFSKYFIRKKVVEPYSQYLLIFLEKKFDNIYQKACNYSLTQKSKNSFARRKERNRDRWTVRHRDREIFGMLSPKKKVFLQVKRNHLKINRKGF